MGALPSHGNEGAIDGISIQPVEFAVCNQVAGAVDEPASRIVERGIAENAESGQLAEGSQQFGHFRVRRRSTVWVRAVPSTCVTARSSLDSTWLKYSM